MKSNVKRKITFLLFLGIVFTLSAISNSNFNFTGGNSTYSEAINFDNENLKLSKISGKIIIGGNSEWSAAKAAGICTGSGTYSDPYVIEDLVIDAGGSGSGILIANSDVHFIITNCTAYNSEGRWSFAGIRLMWVENGNLNNNNCSSNYLGIELEHSGNNIISENILNDNANSGIHVKNCSTHIISRNNISRNGEIGIYIENSANVTISENYVIDSGWENAYDDGTNNHWDNGVIGNYWDDYSGKDTDDDGIGDTPYAIPGSAGSQDNFPIWDDGPDFKIPGYNLYFLLGILPIVAIVLSKKIKKS